MKIERDEDGWINIKRIGGVKFVPVTALELQGNEDAEELAGYGFIKFSGLDGEAMGRAFGGLYASIADWIGDVLTEQNPLRSHGKGRPAPKRGVSMRFDPLGIIARFTGCFATDRAPLGLHGAAAWPHKKPHGTGGASAKPMIQTREGRPPASKKGTGQRAYLGPPSRRICILL